MYGISSVYSLGFILLVVGFPMIYLLSKSTKHPRNTRIIIFFIILYFFAAFRAPTVGGDLEFYIPHFNEICQINRIDQLLDLRASNFEPGYTFLCWLISRVSKTSMAFLAITGFLSLIGPFYLCKRYSPWPIFSLLVYILLGFYTNTFNNVRQSIAISFFFFSIPHIFKKKPIRFILFILLSASFHFSAIIALIAYPLSKIKLTNKLLLFGFIGGYLTSVLFGTTIIHLIEPFLKYEEILGRGEGRGMMILYIIITCLAFVVFKKNEYNIEPRLRQIAYLFILFLFAATIIQMFAVYYSSIIRLTFYFYIPIICLIPILLSSFNNFSERRFYCLIVMSILFIYMNSIIYSYSSAINSNFQGVIPYVFNF